MTPDPHSSVETPLLRNKAAHIVSHPILFFLPTSNSLHILGFGDPLLNPQTTPVTPADF